MGSPSDYSKPIAKVHFKELDKTKLYGTGMTLYTVASLFATPFLLVKRRQQMGLSSSLLDLWKAEGIRGLFRGGTLSWVSGLNRMIYFTVYEEIGYRLEAINRESWCTGNLSDKSRMSAVSATSAAAACIISQTVLTPLHVITTRLHVSQTQLSAWSVLKSIIVKYGRVGILWTGYTSALVQAIPTNMTMFAVYNISKTYAQDLGLMNSPEADLMARIACSFIGTYAAIMVTAPIDIARTHREVMTSEVTSSTSKVLPSATLSVVGGAGTMTATSVVAVPSTWSVMKDIYKQHGARRMYAGATARLLSSTPYTLAMLVGYDYVRLFAHVSDAND